MDLDITLLFQLGIFCFVLVALKVTFFKPLLQLLEARHQRTHGALQEAAMLEQAGQADEALYQEQLERARHQAQQQLRGLREVARLKQQQRFEGVRHTLAQQLRRERDLLAEQEQVARQQLRVAAPVLAGLLMEKVVGRRKGR